MNDPKKIITQLLCDHGFKRRGAAYFRVYGDGVFQVLKYVTERTCKGLMLRIGLNSMYSEMQPQWFTSSNCLVRHELAKVIGERYTANLGDLSNGFVLQAYSLEQQLQILEQYGVHFLNSMGTQQQLLEKVHQLETAWGGSVRWNDSTKIAPYLVTNNLQMAEKVVDAILDQHVIASNVNQKHMPEEVYLEWKKREEAYDVMFHEIKKMIQQKNIDKIQCYLQRNYEINCQLARFCMK